MLYIKNSFVKIIIMLLSTCHCLNLLTNQFLMKDTLKNKGFQIFLEIKIYVTLILILHFWQDFFPEP